MITVAVFRPSVPAGGLAPYDFGRRVFLFEFCDCAAKVLFDGFADELLFSVELEADIIQCPAVAVLSIFRYWEYLIV